MISFTSWMEDDVSKEQCRLWQRKKVWTLSLLAKSWRLFKSLFRRHLANLWQVAFSRATKQRQVVNVAVVLHDPLRRDLYSRYLLSASAVHQSPRGFVSRMAPPDDAGGLRPPLHQPKMYRNASTTSRREMVHRRCFILHTFWDSNSLFLSGVFLVVVTYAYWIIQSDLLFLPDVLGRSNICVLNHSVAPFIWTLVQFRAFKVFREKNLETVSEFVPYNLFYQLKLWNVINIQNSHDYVNVDPADFKTKTYINNRQGLFITLVLRKSLK